MMTEDGYSKAKKKGKMMESLARKYKERPLVRAIVIKIPVVGASIDVYFEYGRKTEVTPIEHFHQSKDYDKIKRELAHFDEVFDANYKGRNNEIASLKQFIMSLL